MENPWIQQPDPLQRLVRMERTQQSQLDFNDHITVLLQHMSQAIDVMNTRILKLERQLNEKNRSRSGES